jgi:hypothetical protein
MTKDAASGGSPHPPAMAVDTTAGSVLHMLSKILVRLGFGAFIPVGYYVVAVSLTFLPLVIVGFFSPLSMTIRSDTLRMPFFYDFPSICMFVVSLPCLLMLTVTDDLLLNRSLSRVHVDGILTISEAIRETLANRWYRYFRSTNLAAQAVGILAGCITAYFIYMQAISEQIGSWLAPDKHMLPNGYVFLYCIILLAVVTTVYIFRSIAIGLLLRDVVAHAELHMLPLHPDKAGGLRPIGRLGLRNQYAITLIGLNIALALFVSYFFLKNNNFIGTIVIATIACLTFGPLVFLWPLLPFRDGMTRNKAQLMNGVALRMRVQLDDLRSRFQSGAITIEDEQLIDRLRKIGGVIDDMPVWPFDAVILRKFLTAYVTPLAITALSVPAGAAWKLLLLWLRQHH